jgi:hypothetical protein
MLRVCWERVKEVLEITRAARYGDANFESLQDFAPGCP